MLQPRLHLRDLRQTGQPEGRFDLSRSPIRIGRGPRCEIRLHSEEIADVQVILRRDGNRWLIHPVGPCSGCLFNGEQLTETQSLLPGTQFTIGHVELTMSDGQPATKQAPPAAEIVAQVVAEPAPIMPEPAAKPEPLISTAPAVLETVVPPVVETVQPIVAAAPKPAPEPAPMPLAAKAHATGLEFEQTGLLADLARRALEKSHRRQPIASIANLKSAAPASALAQTLAEQPLARNLPSFNSNRASVRADSAASLSDWADDFSRRYRNGQTPVRQPEVLAQPDLAYEPKPLPRFRKVSHSAISGDSFLEGMPHSAARPATMAMAAEALAELKPTETLADFSSVVVELLPSDHLQTEQDCFHESPHAFHEVQMTTDDEMQAAVVEAIDYELPTSDEPLVAELQPSLPAAEFHAEQLAEVIDEEPLHLPHGSTSVQISECLSPEKFEEWIGTVGSILESLGHDSPDTPAFEVICPEVEIVTYDAEVDHESGSAELDIVVADYPLSADAEMPITLETVAKSFNLHEAVVEETASEVEVEDEFAAAEIQAIAEQEIKAEIAAEPAEESIEHDETEGQWPSVQDIMRWSAVREGQFGDDEPMQRASQVPDDHDIAPRQMMRVNLPVACLLCLAWLGVSAVLVRAAMRIGMQDELTQKTISAINTASLNNAPPRLPASQIQKLSSVPAWWSITGDQIWWRATFLKMREQTGQAGAEPADNLAEKALGLNPLLPQGRLWNVTRTQASQNPDDWAGLSRDVLSLMLVADHHRRIGDDEKANAADRQALELVTAPDRVLIDRKVLFDAELGTGRFLLPNQKDVLEILKRLAKEPNAAEVIAKIMPENRPLVWLTAAQFLKQAGLGDPEPELARIMAWQSPARASLDQRRVEEAIRAEALAMQGKTVEAAEIYVRLTQTSPDSVWKRAWFFNHGELSQRNQKTDAALISWRKARGEDPNHEVDRHAIQASRSLSSNLGDSGSSRNTIRTN